MSCKEIMFNFGNNERVFSLNQAKDFLSACSLLATYRGSRLVFTDKKISIWTRDAMSENLLCQLNEAEIPTVIFQPNMKCLTDLTKKAVHVITADKNLASAKDVMTLAVLIDQAVKGLEAYKMRECQWIFAESEEVERAVVSLTDAHTQLENKFAPLFGQEQRVVPPINNAIKKVFSLNQAKEFLTACSLLETYRGSRLIFSAEQTSIARSGVTSENVLQQMHINQIPCIEFLKVKCLTDLTKKTVKVILADKNHTSAKDVMTLAVQTQQAVKGLIAYKNNECQQKSEDHVAMVGSSIASLTDAESQLKIKVESLIGQRQQIVQLNNNPAAKPENKNDVINPDVKLDEINKGKKGIVKIKTPLEQLEEEIAEFDLLDAEVSEGEQEIPDDNLEMEPSFEELEQRLAEVEFQLAQERERNPELAALIDAMSPKEVRNYIIAGEEYCRELDQLIAKESRENMVLLNDILEVSMRLNNEVLSLMARLVDRNDAKSLKMREDLGKLLDQMQIDEQVLKEQEQDIAIQEKSLQDIETKMNEIFAKAKTNVDELKEEPKGMQELRDFKF